MRAVQAAMVAFFLMTGCRQADDPILREGLQLEKGSPASGKNPIIVSKVSSSGRAWALGLRDGDVIYAINDEDVIDHDVAVEQLRTMLDRGERVLIGVIRPSQNGNRFSFFMGSRGTR